MPEQQFQNTLSNYVTRVRRYLGETNPAKSHWDDPFLKEVFNASYRRRCAQLVMAYEGYFTLIVEFNLEANQSLYPWPSGFNRMERLEVKRTDGRLVPIERFQRHTAVSHPPENGGGSQDTYLPDYRPIGGGFILEPAPQEAVSKGLRMEYTGTPEELTADGDGLHSDFPNILDELVVLDAAIMAMDQESTQETGQMSSLLRLRAEWELDWDRFIDSRVVASQQVTPFSAHYHDA